MTGSNGLRVALGAGAALALLLVLVATVPYLTFDTGQPMKDQQTGLVGTAAPDPDVLASDARPQTAGPQIDTVRIDPDGQMLIAGRAAAGDLVRILVDDTPMAETLADSQGQFVGFVTLAPSDRPRRLSLIGDPEGAALVSDATTIIAPTLSGSGGTVIAPIDDPRDAAAPEDVPAEIASAPAAEAAAPADADASQTVDTAVQADDAMPTGSATARRRAAALAQPAPGADPARAAPRPQVVISAPQPAPPASPEAPARPPVLRADASGLRLLQPALGPGATPEVLDTVALDAIAYDDGGALLLSGRAVGGGLVRVYIDNAAVLETEVGGAGTWDGRLTDVAPGLYTLRVDQIDATGAVASRIQIPFLREPAGTVEASLRDEVDANGLAIRTVQPGNTLWGISEERYGDGMAYLMIFEANVDRIRDPDLIYPGQIFRMPEAGIGSGDE